MCDNLGISDEKVEVYELNYLGQRVIFQDLGGLMVSLHADIENTDCDEPQEMTITKKLMRESEFKNLPEFEGY